MIAIFRKSKALSVQTLGQTLRQTKRQNLYRNLFVASTRLAAISALTTIAITMSGNAFAQDAATSSAPVLQPGTAAAAGGGGSAPAWMNLVLIGGMVLFMYLFVIRPNAKRQKEHKVFIESLVPGKEVITSSGLIGKITSVADTVVTIDLGSTTVRVLKSAVSGELGKATANVATNSLTSPT